MRELNKQRKTTRLKKSPVHVRASSALPNSSTSISLRMLGLSPYAMFYFRVRQRRQLDVRCASKGPTREVRTSERASGSRTW
ncbi:hypothetical protein PILCRDRAFT_668571 [Piloderma croceum F 1598]|uniref:Uncharacterized protein n=1 Tax=Piloderma croceum (strain F 1598) TaxID=765440 RepID=A0A0C3ESY4_PILCF|nr:hypothetical protein PILCRDRAFT_668571 [Piloderma croceum F 1598]